MARILRRRGLFEVRGATKEAMPRDPGMSAQQAISTASSALKLGTQIASLVGKIPVKDERAKKLEELEKAKQVALTQQQELDQQREMARQAAMAQTPEALTRAQEMAAADLQGRRAMTERMEAADRAARGFGTAAQIGGLSLEEMSATAQRVAGLPPAAFEAQVAGPAGVRPTVLPGQQITPPGTVEGFRMPPGMTRDDITRGNEVILQEATTFKLEDFVQNPSQAAAEIDRRFTALETMNPANVEQQQRRAKEMARLRDEKTSLLGMGRLGAEGQAALRRDLEASERELAEAQAAITGFETARADVAAGKERMFAEREKQLDAEIARIEAQMPALKRKLTDVIADARFATKEEDKRRLIKEAASMITPRNVKESVFGVDALKLQAVEKVLKQMPKSLTEKEIQDILNKKSLIASRDAKRKRDDELQPEKLADIRSKTSYRDARKAKLEEFKPLEKTKLQEQINKLRKEQKRIDKAGKKRDPAFTQAVGALRRTLQADVTRLQKMVDTGEGAKAFRDNWAGAKPTAPNASQFPAGEDDADYFKALKEYENRMFQWNRLAVDANVNFDLFGSPGKLSANKSALQKAKDKLEKFIKQYGGTPVDSTDDQAGVGRTDDRGDFE